MYYIYEIKNKINGKTYIGQRKCPKNKFPETDTKYMGSGTLIINSENKYGIENFSKSILAVTETKENVDILEKFFIALYRSEGKAEYNMADGGQGGGCSGEFEIQRRLKISKGNIGKPCWNKGKKNVYSEETLKMMSISHKNRPMKDESKIKLSKIKKGRKLSEKCIQNIIKSHLGKKLSDETKKKISNSQKGLKKKPMSIEGRMNISKAGKGRIPWNKGLKGKQVAWNKGLKFSEESRKKMSESHKGQISPNKGKKLSNETKLKISISLKKRNMEKRNETKI